MLKRIISVALALMLMAALAVGLTVSAAENVPTEFTAYIAYGGGQNWEYSTWSGKGDVDGITEKTAKLSVGETVTISLTFANQPDYTWCVSPCLVADDVTGITALEYTISCKIDGKEVTIDHTAGDAWWGEDTGDYKAASCLRLAGGYNEWGGQYIASPANFTTIEYTITLTRVNDITASPKTGDALSVVLGLLAVSGVGITVLAKKKF